MTSVFNLHKDGLTYLRKLMDAGGRIVYNMEDENRSTAEFSGTRVGDKLTLLELQMLDAIIAEIATYSSERVGRE